MARIKKWTPCIVSWHDAVTVSEPSCSDDHEAFSPAKRCTIGFFIRRSREGITIAMEDDRSADLGADHDCQVVTTIPRGMVRSVTTLTRDEPLPRKPRVKKTPDAI